MATVTVKRDGNTVDVVIREPYIDEVVSGPCWKLMHLDDRLSMHNIWTLRLPADEAEVLVRGLTEAGVGPRLKRAEDE